MPVREKRAKASRWWPAGPFSRHNACADRRESRASSVVAAEFTGEADSAAEGTGFEPSVPLKDDPVSGALPRRQLARLLLL